MIFKNFTDHLRVHMERAQSFYMGLGMNLVWQDEDWCYLEAGPNRDGLALLGPEYKEAGPHFAFHFSDRGEVENIHVQLKKQGVQVGSLHNHRDGTASFYLKDSEGNSSVNKSMKEFNSELGKIGSYLN